MVSAEIVSRCTGQLPVSADADRGISCGPLYPVEELLGLLRDGDQRIRAWTKKCIADLEKLALDGDDLVEFLIERALQKVGFRVRNGAGKILVAPGPRVMPILGSDRNGWTSLDERCWWIITLNLR